MDNIAFLGLGIMGGSMAANLARAGFKVRGWNRTASKPGLEETAAAGVHLLPEVDAAVVGAQAVFLCLGDERDIEEILVGKNGIARSFQPGTLVVDMSTTGPKCAQTLDTALRKLHLRFLDAPVSGGDVGAKQGTLTIMVGGEKTDFDDALPLFQAMGKNITYCGPAGSGQTVKLCNQILCAVNMVAVCEAINLAESMGIDPRLVVDVCGTGAAGSWALTNLGSRINKSDFEPGFMIKHMLKDLRLVEESAGDSANFPGTRLAQQNFEKVQDKLGTAGGAKGTQAMMRVYRD